MTKYFYRDGEQVQENVFEEKSKLFAHRYCGKCGGTGMTPYFWVHDGVCFSCGGSKFSLKASRVFTKEELDKLNKNAEVRTQKRMAKIEIENTLKISGIKFRHHWKSFNKSIKNKSWKEFQTSKYIKYTRDHLSLEILESKTKDFWIKVNSDFVALGKCIKELTLLFKHGFETQYGYSQIFKFVDSQNNQYVWFTSSFPELEKGKTYNAKFIVKDNQESDQYGKQNMIKNFKEVK